MHENKLEELAERVDKFLSKETYATKKINEMEDRINKMSNYFFPTQIQAVNNFEEKSVLNEFIRKGTTSELITKSLSGNAAEAGVLITPDLSRKIISEIATKSPMRQIAAVETISSRSLDLIIENGAFASGWIGEVEKREATDTPALKKKTIVTHEIFAQPKATQSLIDDAEIDIEQWLKERLVNSFTKLENEAFINGDGANSPHGLLKNADIEKIEVGEGGVTIDCLLKLINSLNEGYLANASFLMNRSTLSVIQSLKDKTERFIWQQSLTDPLKQSIFGIPIVISSNMPDIASDKLSIALGDFKSAYKIVDRSGINLLRDPYTDKPFIRFYAVKRVGGDVVNPGAVKFAQFA